MRGKAAEMENRDWMERYREELIDFYRQGVRTRSYSDEEGEYARLILNKMKELGYVYVANNADELKELLMRSDLKPLHELGDFASNSLIDELCRVIG